MFDGQLAQEHAQLQPAHPQFPRRLPKFTKIAAEVVPRPSDSNVLSAVTVVALLTQSDTAILMLALVMSDSNVLSAVAVVAFGVDVAAGVGVDVGTGVGVEVGVVDGTAVDGVAVDGVPVSVAVGVAVGAVVHTACDQVG